MANQQGGQHATSGGDRDMDTIGRNGDLERIDPGDLNGGVDTDDRFHGRGGGGHESGSYANTLSQHGGYGEGNYGQRGQQDSYGQGNFGLRGTGVRGGQRDNGPQDLARSDERLVEHVSELLTEHDEIDASHLHVSAKDGEVTLTGTVDDRGQRRMIQDLIEGISGVRDIHMAIELATPTPGDPAADAAKARA